MRRTNGAGDLDRPWRGARLESFTVHPVRSEELARDDRSTVPPVRRDYCTYFDHRYLAKGLALYRSLERHAGEFRLHVLALTPECARALEALELERARIVSLTELEAADPELEATKASRSTVEYYFTSTAPLLRFLLNREPEVELLTYLDADVAFFSDPEPLFEEIGASSLAIVSHRFPDKLRHLERHGKFNVAWVTIRRDPSGLSALEWWRERCLEWCFDRVEPERFADQKYLDSWPTRFEGVRVIEHPGADLAPWNLESHLVTATSDGEPRVDGRPLVFYHAHRFDFEAGVGYEAHLEEHGVEPAAPVISAILEPYSTMLERATAELASAGLDQLDSDVGGTIRASHLISLRAAVRRSEIRRQQEVGELERRLGVSEADRAARLDVIERLDSRSRDLERELRAIRSSWTWKVTRPLRWLGALARREGGGGRGGA